MARCIYCGAETSLYVHEQPVCLKCEEGLSKGRKPAQSEQRFKNSTAELQYILESIDRRQRAG
jgi:hypothetical protein